MFCLYCFNEFYLFIILDDTSEEWKENIKDFQCEKCGKECKTEEKYNNHKQFHKYYLDNVEQKYCNRCCTYFPKRLFQRHLERVHHAKKSAFNIINEGIFESVTENTFMRTKRVWENFCKVSYDNHKKQPTEKMFLEYLQLKKETGSSPAFVADSYRCLCRVFLYLFGQEFESILVEEYVMKESENIVKRTYPCPHCGEVCFISFHYSKYTNETKNLNIKTENRKVHKPLQFGTFLTPNI